MSLSNDELSKLWDSANLLRKNLDAAEYKHIVLGLVFLKYISDSFDGRCFSRWWLGLLGRIVKA